MDWSAAVAVIGTLLGAVIGSGLQMLQAHRQRDWHNNELQETRAHQVRVDRREAYGQFMAAASAYGNRLYELWDGRDCPGFG